MGTKQEHVNRQRAGGARQNLIVMARFIRAIHAFAADPGNLKLGCPGQAGA
jgi:hypothetical protein